MIKIRLIKIISVYVKKIKYKWINDYSLCGLILVNMTAKTITEIIMIRSIVISNGLAVLNNVIIPTIHIPIKTKGSKYLIINIHVLPTLNVEYSFNAGRNLSTP